MVYQTAPERPTMTESQEKPLVVTGDPPYDGKVILYVVKGQIVYRGAHG